MDKKEFLRSLEILSELRELASLYCKDEKKEHNQKNKEKEEEEEDRNYLAARYFYGSQFLSEIAR